MVLNPFLQEPQILAWNINGMNAPCHFASARLDFRKARSGIPKIAAGPVPNLTLPGILDKLQGGRRRTQVANMRLAWRDVSPLGRGENKNSFSRRDPRLRFANNQAGFRFRLIKREAERQRAAARVNGATVGPLCVRAKGIAHGYYLSLQMQLNPRSMRQAMPGTGNMD